MHLLIRCLFFFCVFVVHLKAASAEQAEFGGILVTPPRAILTQSAPSTVFYIANNTGARSAFELQLADSTMNENGSLIMLPSALNGRSITDIVRFAPRQFALAPGEIQIVRVQARRMELAREHEAIGHLRVAQRPRPVATDVISAGAPSGIGVHIQALPAVAVPIFVRARDDVAVGIDGVSWGRGENGRREVVLDLWRAGYASAGIDVHVVGLGAGGEEVVARRERVGIYSNLEALTLRIPVELQDARRFSGFAVRVFEHQGRTPGPLHDEARLGAPS